jgi:hypothetical protein
MRASLRAPRIDASTYIFMYVTRARKPIYIYIYINLYLSISLYLLVHVSCVPPYALTESRGRVVTYGLLIRSTEARMGNNNDELYFHG